MREDQSMPPKGGRAARDVAAELLKEAAIIAVAFLYFSPIIFGVWRWLVRG